MMKKIVLAFIATVFASIAFAFDTATVRIVMPNGAKLRLNKLSLRKLKRTSSAR